MRWRLPLPIDTTRDLRPCCLASCGALATREVFDLPGRGSQLFSVLARDRGSLGLLGAHGSSPVADPPGSSPACTRSRGRRGNPSSTQSTLTASPGSDDHVSGCPAPEIVDCAGSRKPLARGASDGVRDSASL